MRPMKYMLPIAATIAALLLTVSGCPEVVEPLFDVAVTKDQTYGVGYVATDSPGTWTTKPLLLDVYEPVDAEGLRPAVVLVHGGSFSEGSKEKTQIVEYANFFAGQGYVAFAINYRLTGDNPPAPDGWAVVNLVAAAHAAMVDVKAALRFVHANAGAYNIDPERIALLGESAGAIAGVSAAMADPDDYALDRDDLPIPETNHPDARSDVAAYVHLWGSADHVLLEVDASDPPVMIVHGTKDDEFFASFSASERFDAVLGFVGVPHVFYEAENFGHGAWDFVFERKRIPQLALNFLGQYLN